MADKNAGTDKSTKAAKERRARQTRARRSLGLDNKRPLPRCDHKVTKRVKEFEAKGDFSHSDKKHICDECACKRTAGHGTDHYGSGWCNTHDRCYDIKHRHKRAETMTDLIRAGVPDKLWRFNHADEFMKDLQKKADESQELFDLRENQIALVGMIQMVLSAVQNRQKPDGSLFTESSKDGNIEASDATLIKLLPPLMNAMTQTVKVELEVKDEDYVHWDDCAIFFAGIMKVVKRHVEPDMFKIITKDLRDVQQPRRGRRKNKK